MRVEPISILTAAASLLLLSGGNALAQGSVAADRAALVTLYDATNGPNWTTNNNWLSEFEEDQAGLAGLELHYGSGRPDLASLEARDPSGTRTPTPRGIAPRGKAR